MPAGGRIWVLVLALGLEDRDRHRLCVRRNLHTERVVRSTDGLSARAASYDLNRPEGLLPLDHILGPTAGVQRGINQLGPCLSFASHRRPCDIGDGSLLGKMKPATRLWASRRLVHYLSMTGADGASDFTFATARLALSRVT
jgi:hypothetical protein